MNKSQLNQEDFDFLVANARAAKDLGITDFLHLDQPIGIWNYIRIADDIKQQISNGHVLDWGCGFGQMTYLLRRRGFQAAPFNIGDPNKKNLPDIPLCRDMEVVYTLHPTTLPFVDKTFDAVLSCGVLEHVDEFSQPGNEIKSLHEIARVLRPGGYLLIYQLPQRYSWTELIIRKLKLGYAHTRRYTVNEITLMLQQAGYTVKRVRRANIIPKNLTGIPSVVRNFYSRFSNILYPIDDIFCKIPGINNIAGVMEITAQCQK